MRKNFLYGLICLACIGLCFLYGMWILKPTSQDTKKADLYEKTMNHLQNIASKPHASGSEAIVEVRKYLIKQLDEIGVSYEIDSFQLDRQEGIDCITRYDDDKGAVNKYYKNLAGIEFVNILVKLDAPNTEKAVMFMAHYDSVAAGPGATDDGISVASMLTVIDEVVTTGGLTNDIYFLFTDGEELGLVGADHFTQKYTDIYGDKIELVINLEARGNRGTLLMFQTSENDYEIANMLKSAVKSGSTPFSATVSLYKQLPNDTDFTAFLNNGYSGLNFAVIEGGDDYHTVFDSVEELNKDTAYMYYATVSELAEYLKDADLSKLESENTGTYFPVAKGKFLLFHETTIHIISIVSMILFLVLLIYLFRKKIIYGKRMLSSAGLTLGILLLTTGLAYVCDIIGASILEKKAAKEFFTKRVIVSVREDFIFPLLVLTVVLVMFIYIIFRKKSATLTEHLCTFGIFFEAISIILLITYREMIYFTGLTLLMISLILIMMKTFRDRKLRILPVLASGVLTFVVSVLYIPIVSLIYQAMFLGTAGYDLVLFTVILTSFCGGTLIKSLNLSSLR